MAYVDTLREEFGDKIIVAGVSLLIGTSALHWRGGMRHLREEVLL